MIPRPDLSPEALALSGATKLGHDIVTASGTTLLGADDKAGIAVIMTAARLIAGNPRRIPDPPRLHPR
jgi:tripeptide aminopeptidase